MQTVLTHFRLDEGNKYKIVAVHKLSKFVGVQMPVLKWEAHHS